VTNIRNLDWNDLRDFLAAARSGTLAGAGRALGVKHSTVGRRLTALERALGAVVVIRGEHGLQLTALGEKMVPYAEAIERSAAELQGCAGGHTTRVRIAVPTGMVKLFAPHLAELRRKHPELSLEFLSGSQPMDLHKSEAEIAVRLGPIADDTLVVRKIGELGWSLYASPAYLTRHPEPLDPRDLAGHDVLGFDERLTGAPGAKWLADHGAGANIVLVNREMADVAAAAVAGLGLAVLPCIIADSEPGVRRLTQEVLGHQSVSIVYRREVTLASPVSIAIRFVSEVMRQQLVSSASE
jgi:DNA-binding transcriptional LysR family regulator